MHKDRAGTRDRSKHSQQGDDDTNMPLPKAGQLFIGCGGVRHHALMLSAASVEG